ncbi:MAG: Na+ dependent nucleoside transporter N-terminal domain-containing protein [Planctomycetota bacterium]|jgi:hypothetical protein
MSKKAKAAKKSKTANKPSKPKKPDSPPEGGARPGRSRRWETAAIAGGVVAIIGVNALLGWSESEWALRFASFLGIVFLLGLALLMSADRRKIPLRTVLAGLALQLAVAVLALRTRVGGIVFGGVARAFDAIFTVSGKGAAFVFGDLAGGLPVPPFTKDGAFVLAIAFVSIIVFMGAASRILYHVGLLQLVVRGMAWLMRRLMRTSGAESLSAGANVFVGMVEAPLTIRPYVAGLTRSELFCVMTAGMATVAGSVLAFYAFMVRDVLGPGAAGHLPHCEDHGSRDRDARHARRRRRALD